MNISMTRAALLEKLNERLAAAQIEDKRLAKEHKVAEADVLKKFKENIRTALKWDYEAAKKNNFEACIRYQDRPSCPRLHATEIARVIRCINFDTRKANFRIHPGTDLYAAVMWLPKSERPMETACG